MADARVYEHAQALLEQCRATEIKFSPSDGENMKKRSAVQQQQHRARAFSKGEDYYAPFRTALQWVAGCEELLAALRPLPTGQILRVDRAEARFLYGAASVKSASSRRSTSPRAVDSAAASDLWRALANFALADTMLKNTRFSQQQVIKRASPGVAGDRAKIHAHDLLIRINKILRKCRVSQRRATKVRSAVHAGLLHTHQAICHVYGCRN